MEGCQGTTIQNVLVPYVRGYSSTQREESQEETKKILEEMKKAEKKTAANGGFLSFLLRILVFINESVELSERWL